MTNSQKMKRNGSINLIVSSMKEPCDETIEELYTIQCPCDGTVIVEITHKIGTSMELRNVVDALISSFMESVQTVTKTDMPRGSMRRKTQLLPSCSWH